MKLKKDTFALAAASLAMCGMANAHIVALGWKSLGGGTVEFSVLHWHGNHEADGVLIFDGVSYPFTSVTWDTPVLTGFSGALVNSEYATWDGAGTITAIAGEENWMHVTISGIGPGNHTVTAPDHPEGLTDWTLDGDITTFEFNFTGGDSERLLSSTLRASSISISRTMTRDVGSRLFRLRSGIRGEAVQPPPSPPTYSAKGGAKGAKSPIVMPPEYCKWEVYGQVFYFSEDQDDDFETVSTVPGQSFRLQTQAETSVDIFGGTVGFEYDFNPNWSAGFAVSAAGSDIDIKGGFDTDVDSFALIPYVSYYNQGLVGGGDFYADLMYAYADHDYDMDLGPLSDSADGHSHQLEFTAGLNFRSGQLVHGPYASLRWIDGEIDDHAFSGGNDTDYESLASQLGYQVSYPMAMGGGTLVPQGRVAWEHEFEEDQGSFAGLPLGELDEDLAVLGAGIGYYMNCGWNVVLDYEARLGSNTDSHYVGLKVGKEF